jgi:TonB family protein
MPRLSRLWFFIVAFPITLMASVPPANLTDSRLSEREGRAWKAPARDTEFKDIPQVSARWHCTGTGPPEALTTPDPLVVPVGSGTKIKVSFIVGTDGRVHSPLILESAGAVQDRNVLRTIRSWRYRPATCNGIPTEAEGQIEFSRR